MINDAAYQCVNAAKRRQIAAPGHFKRAHRGSVSVENACERAHRGRRRAETISRSRDREFLPANQLNREYARRIILGQRSKNISEIETLRDDQDRSPLAAMSIRTYVLSAFCGVFHFRRGKLIE